MRFTTPFLLPIAVLGAICPHGASAKAACPYGYGEFQPEQTSDARGPCPVLNTLANHGYLPRDGRHIDENRTLTALHDALNLDIDFGKFLFTAGRLSNPKANSTWFDLDHLSRHGIFEHDGSLSRQDHHFGEWSRFNQTVWNWTLEYLPGDILDVQTVANARAQRMTRSNLTNPDFALSYLGYLFSVGEAAAVLSILGDKKTQTCPKAFADYIFVNERLPYELGWKKQDASISFDDLVETFEDLERHTSFPFPPPLDNSTDIFDQLVEGGQSKKKRCSAHIGCF